MESKRLLYLPVFCLLWVLLPLRVSGAATLASDTLAAQEANPGAIARQNEEEFQRKWAAETKSETYHYRNLKEQSEPELKLRSPSFKLPFWFIKSIPIIAWVLLIAIALFIVYSIIANWGDVNLFARKNKNVAASVDEETISEEMDWHGLYLKAQQEGDMRMMIRYSFLGILQLLRDERLIEYRDDKTNFDYQRELKTAEFKQLFKRMTRVYEYVWYGDLQLSETVVADYLQTFTLFRDQLKKR